MSEAATPAPATDVITAHRKRSDKAWAERVNWQTLYDEIYDYCIPYRRPASSRHGIGGNSRIEKIYDLTAPVSIFAGAGRLQHDLFPPGQPSFKFAIGPVAKLALKKAKIDVETANRELEQISAEVNAFFTIGEFETATLEMCIDLFAGFGCLLPVEGDDDIPVRYVCVPMDEVALEPGPYGDTGAIFWKTKMTRRNIRAAFKRGKFPAEFLELLAKSPEDDITINQDWVRDYDAKLWRFCVWLGDSKPEDPAIATATMKAQPMAVPRYHKVPGEAYGRGPAMLALPTVKTLNKAVELMLKSAAIQMLGLWAYRPGGAFNPDTVRIAPGAFWPMGSTGGALGPDVTRLDPAAGRMEIGQLITTEMRTQLQQALNDERLPNKGATPSSATEIMAHMKRVSQNYVGAYGRLVNEIVPVLVRRTMEILNKKKLLTRTINIDTLLIAIDVQSPMAAAIKSQAIGQVIEFITIVAQLKGPQAIELLVKLDAALRELGTQMGVPSDFLMTEKETKELEAKLAKAAADMAAMQAQQAQAAAGPQPAQEVPQVA